MSGANLHTPPHSSEAEFSVLGGLLLDNEALDLIDHLTAEDFYSQKHQIIYSALSST